uniref:HEPN domain-containing protein n=1 Tax=Caldimicrobium thiodismutans TaxID=1653476 RepID=A0A832GLZ9_9BACT
MIVEKKELLDLLKKKLEGSPLPVIGAILFGSFAKGTLGSESDLDLLVVVGAETPLTKSRIKEIALLKKHLRLGIPVDIILVTPTECEFFFKNHHPLFLDVAFDGILLLDKDGWLEGLISQTKEEVIAKGHKKLLDGWKFSVKYREATPLSPVTNKDFSKAFLKDAQRDYEIAKILAREGYYDKSIYHFQQAAEKAIKALLFCFGEFKRTHYVSEILINCLKDQHLPDIWAQRLKQIAELNLYLEPEVTRSRYPQISAWGLWLPADEYDEEAAIEAEEKVRVILTTSQEFVAWWYGENLDLEVEAT